MKTLHQRLKCLSAHGLREGSPPLLPSPQSLFVGLGSHTAPLQHFPLNIEKVLNNTGAALRLEKRKPGSGQLPPAQLAALSTDSQLCFFFPLSLEWGYRRGFLSERKGTWVPNPPKVEAVLAQTPQGLVPLASLENWGSRAHRGLGHTSTLSFWPPSTFHRMGEQTLSFRKRLCSKGRILDQDKSPSRKGCQCLYPHLQKWVLVSFACCNEMPQTG